jgi:hypothetical protein
MRRLAIAIAVAGMALACEQSRETADTAIGQTQKFGEEADELTGDAAADVSPDVSAGADAAADAAKDATEAAKKQAADAAAAVGEGIKTE